MVAISLSSVTVRGEESTLASESLFKEREHGIDAISIEEGGRRV